MRYTRLMTVFAECTIRVYYMTSLDSCQTREGNALACHVAACASRWPCMHACIEPPTTYSSQHFRYLIPVCANTQLPSHKSPKSRLRPSCTPCFLPRFNRTWQIGLLNMVGEEKRAEATRYNFPMQKPRTAFPPAHDEIRVNSSSIALRALLPPERGFRLSAKVQP